MEATIIALIATLTTGHILFLAIYLWLRGSTSMPNRILSILLFCYSLRIIKSVLLLAFPGILFRDGLIAMGVIGMSAIGPLIWLYIQSLSRENFKITRQTLLHFIPAIVLLPTAFFLKDTLMFQVYQFSVYQIIFYIGLSFFYLMKWKKIIADHASYKWINELLLAASLLAIIFLIQLYTDSRSVYLVVSLSAAAVFYIISLRAAFVNLPSYPQLKKKTSALKSQLLPAIQEKIVDEKLYLDPQMTVSKLAASLNIPAYTLSSAINEGSGMAFNEFLNTYRVREAAIRMRSPEHEMLSIEGIANDCGFNSLSAFYNAFKKVYQTTPARYRAKSFPDSANREDLIPNSKGM